MKSLILFLILVMCIAVQGAAQAEAPETSGLPLPRFASLKSDNVYVRAGPSMDYPIRWVYKREGLPVEITQEFDAWRKIVDPEGEGGWVHKILLSSGRRAKVSATDGPVTVYREAEMVHPLVKFEQGVVVDVDECRKLFCHVTFPPYSGWIEKKSLWGVYGSEIFN